MRCIALFYAILRLARPRGAELIPASRRLLHCPSTPPTSRAPSRMNPRRLLRRAGSRARSCAGLPLSVTFLLANLQR